MGTITLGSLVFVGIGIVVFIAISLLILYKNKTPQRGKLVNLTFLLVGMGTFFTWLMWVTMYMAQMNPMITPEKKVHHEIPEPVKDEI